MRSEANSHEGSSITSTSESSQQPSKYKALYHTYDVKAVQDQLLNWCIIDHIPFTKVDSPAFKRLMKAISPSLAAVPMSAASLRRWAIQAFQEEKDRMKEVLKKSASKIHVSFDGWSSPNGYAVLAVVAHFIILGPDLKYRNQAVLLALKRMKNRHTAVEISKVLIDVIMDYGFAEILGVFMADNPDTNDNAIAMCLKVIEPTEKNPASRRARCIDHVLNLAAKDFMFGEDVEAFEFDVAGEELADRFDSVAAVKAQRAWRSKGAIGKLYNIVAFIRGSPQRREAFKKIRVGDESIDSKCISSTLNL